MQEAQLNVEWGNLTGAALLRKIDEAYDNVKQWKRNIFKLPSGAAGKAFIRELTNLLNHFNTSSQMEPIALKMVMIFGPLMLQKPFKTSKARDHTQHIIKNMEMWESGDLAGLIRKGTAIQKRLTNSKFTAENEINAFTRHMLSGRVSPALRQISKRKSPMLEGTPDVIEELVLKHPPANEVSSGTLLCGPFNRPEDVIYQSIDSKAIYTAAIETHGSAGPSGIDAEGWQRFLCSKAFGQEAEHLCAAVAKLAQKLATTKVDPAHISAFTACRLIAIDKQPGIRPVRVGEVLRRIVGKALAKVVKRDVANATAPIQSCGGVRGGAEAAVHALRKIWEDEDTEAVLLVDARNAFNMLNRKAALYNTSIVCPELATYLHNTYDLPSKLLIANSGGEEILSREGTTQGDNLAMAFYACSVIPMIKRSRTQSTAKSIWYADDGAGAGKLTDISTFWNFLKSEGAGYGYFTNPGKSILIVKPEHEDRAKQLFTDVQVKMGARYLGSHIGDSESKWDFLRSQTRDWIDDIRSLSRVAREEPHLAYAAYVYGISKKWNYLARTTPDICDHLGEVEESIRSELIPALIGRPIDENYRTILALPARYGGMAIEEPKKSSDSEYLNSVAMTRTLWTAMYQQDQNLLTDEIAMRQVKADIVRQKEVRYKTVRFDVLRNLSEEKARQVELASEKGASSWLSSLPIGDMGFALNRQEFTDAVALRYGFEIPDCPKVCLCGQPNNHNHAQICKKGGFVSIRHNTIRDTAAHLLEKVCHGVRVEPPLLNVGSRQLQPGSNICDGARLDVSARGFWSPLDKAFFDIRVLHPSAASNQTRTLSQMYERHEREKKRSYGSRVIEIERGFFTPLVMSTSGGVGSEMMRFTKKLAEMLARKTRQTYQDTISFIRRRFRVELLRTTLIALRGHRGRFYEEPVDAVELDLNLVGRDGGELAPNDFFGVRSGL